MVEARALIPAGVVATSWAEMCTRFPDQWVVLVDTDWIDHSKREFRSARIVGHDVRRATALAAARPMTSRCLGFGCFFTGRVRAPLLGFFAP